MRLTTKGTLCSNRHAGPGLHHDQGPIRLAGISDRRFFHLEQLFAQLRRQELVKSVRGPGGGYHLGARPVQSASPEVIAAVNEDTDTTRCGGAGDCQDGETCLTHHPVDGPVRPGREFLEHFLGDLVKRQDIRRVSEKQERRTRDSDRRADNIPTSNL